ncbi:hypothetical protein ACS0TY_028655 [Phlomoides rotata]
MVEKTADLTMLHLARFLWEDPPVVDESDTDTARRVAYDQWGQGDFLCQNDVLLRTGGLVVEHVPRSSNC